MRIKNLFVRGFRSIHDSSLTNCGPLNVLIGRNNAGKSNFLATLDVVLEHLKGGAIAGPWRASRPLDQFTERDASRPVQVGVEFELPEAIRDELCDRLKKDAPQLERSIDMLRTFTSLSFIVAGAWKEKGRLAFLFLQDLYAGPVSLANLSNASEARRLLHVPTAAALELFDIFTEQRLFTKTLAPSRASVKNVLA
jgi:energy-coupling factor transporter ATP-binding protein EcfA2